jgi:dTDP-4-dehydrorhamnose 3,5-epimerase
VKFHPLPLPSAALVELDGHSDERGFFARLFCEDEMAAAGLVSHFPQVNNSLSLRKGTIRGLHYQLPPAAETKLIRCIRGTIFDAIADLRPDSTTYGRWYGTTLTAENRLMMYIPKGFAHGFLSLEENSEVIYFASERYTPGQERGIRFDDARIAIAWPIQPTVISAKDRAWPEFNPAAPEFDALRGYI